MINNTYKKQLYTIDEAEKEYLIYDKSLGLEPIIFGFINDQWEKLKSNIKPNDKLYKFSSTSTSWVHLAGKEGFYLIRDSQVIYTIITKID